MRQEVVAIGQTARTARFHGGPQAGLNWRHVATVLLLLITLPVFLTAGLAAVVLLPVLLAFTGAERLRRIVANAPQPLPIRRHR
ncbi:MAG TPA: hypothetical protein PLX45_09695 [Piscinibacter sp.]|nr:hypothetical protein [Piscinibacter sp.]HNW64107.1 hypothetical protein [Piscinibacter sp.]HOY36643.1 hypothetical protein [Piscinibacter sp.]HPG81219.1 hypothetical protein [Piscinibacter sp.]HPM66515.1 hypothetical protein [Piscinibacter sp.]